MEKMFGSMMQEFFKNISDKDGQDMKSCFDKMAAMCPCMNMSAMTEEDKGKMIRRDEIMLREYDGEDVINL